MHRTVPFVRLPVYSLMLVVFSLTTGEFLIAGILHDVAADLAVSIPAVGLLVTAYALGMIVGGPLVTVLSARLPRKPLVVGLVAVSVVGNLGSAVAPNYALLLVARFVAGLVVATFFAVAIATAVSLAPAGRQASSVARLTLGMNLGIVLGAPIGTFIGHNLDWRTTFAAIAAVTCVALVLVLRFVPPQPATAAGLVLRELRVLANRDVQLAITLTAVGNVGAVAVFTYIAPLLTDVSGFAAGAIPGLLLVYGAGALVGNFLGGWLADKALMRSLTGLLAVLVLVLAVFWLLASLRAAAAILTFLVGVVSFAIIPGMQTRVVAMASAAPTLAVAVNASGFQLATAFASWLGGRVIAAALILGGLAIALYSLRRDRQPAPAPSEHVTT